MKKVVAFAVLACLLSMTLGAALTHADESTPQLPHAFYGDVSVNGIPASVGTSVEARGEGVQTGIAGNPLLVSPAGKYGGAGALDPKLVVQGSITPGTILTFYVNGVSTGQTATWHSGEVTQLELSVTIAAPPPAPPPPTVPTIEVDFFGGTASITVNNSGVVQATAELTSPAGDLTITIPEGTMALDMDGEPLTSLDINIDDDPPDPPEDANVLGLAYDFGPPGTTFDPWIQLEWSYDPAELEAGVDEEDIDIAFYDDDAGEWVVIDCVVHPESCGTYTGSGACCEVNPADNSVTAYVTHFTIFTLIVTLPPPVEEEPPVVEKEEPVVEEEEEPAVVEEEEPVVVEEEEEPVVVEEEEPVVEEEEEIPEAAGVNWPVVGGIIGGVVVVAGLIGFLWYRRRAYS
jgi:hypothetical protein